MNIKQAFDHGIVLGRLLERAYSETINFYLADQTEKKIESLKTEISEYQEKFDNETTETFLDKKVLHCTLPKGLTHCQFTNIVSGVIEVSTK